MLKFILHKIILFLPCMFILCIIFIPLNIFLIKIELKKKLILIKFSCCKNLHFNLFITNIIKMLYQQNYFVFLLCLAQRVLFIKGWMLFSHDSQPIPILSDCLCYFQIKINIYSVFYSYNIFFLSQLKMPFQISFAIIFLIQLTMCFRFLQFYSLNMPSGEYKQLSLGHLAQELEIEKRRVYDIINVVSSLSMAVKVRLLFCFSFALNYGRAFL